MAHLVRASLPILLLGSLARAGIGLPDLVPDIDRQFHYPFVERNQSVSSSDVAEGCAGGTTGRDLLRFTLSTTNAGTADLVLGDPGCPDCTLFPGPTCENPLYECSPVEGHGHGHFSQYALYEIIPAPGADAVVTGHKQGFCLEDTICGTQTYTCEYQGLTVGCRDVYPFILGCQYVDVTGIPGGRYLLRTTVNYAGLLEESDYDNNVDEVPVEVCEGIAGPKAKLKRKKRSPDTLVWRIKGKASARVGLVDPDPHRNGARLRLEGDGEPLVDVVIPGQPGNGHCGPKDGWKRNRGTFTYVNESGYLDRDCTVPSGGLRSLKVKVKAKGNPPSAWKVRYKIAGALATNVDPARLRTTLVLGAETGSCWTGASDCDGRQCTGDSAGGAFVD